MQQFNSRSKTLGLLLAVSLSLYQAIPGQAACLDTLGTFDRGEVFSAHVEGGLAYLGSGRMLLVVDVSAPSQPSLLGEVRLDVVPLSITVIDDLAYVVGQGLQVVDVSDPAAPANVGTTFFSGTAREVVEVPGFLLIHEGNSLRVYDLNDPEAPTFVESLFFGVSSSSSGHIEVVGSLAYVPSFSGLHLVDLTDPTEPTLVSTVDIGGVAAVKTTGPHAIVVGGNNREFVVLDVSDPTSPVIVGELNLEAMMRDVELIGDFAVVGAGNNSGTGRLLSIDISTLTAPQLVRLLELPAEVDDLFVDGGTLHAAQTAAGLGVFDATDPLNIQQLGTYSTPAAIGGAERQGDLLFLAAGHGGVRVLDISDASLPTEVATHPTDGEAYELRLQGNTALVANGSGGFLSLDISDPLQIQELDRRTDQNLTRSLGVTPGLAYLADEFFGLRIVDFSSPAALVEVGQLEIGDRAEQLIVDGSFLYLADAHDGLRIFDVSDPMLPQQVGIIDTPGWSSRIGKSGDFVYINTQSSSDSRVIDVSDPTQPVLRAIDDCNSRAILLDGEFGYVSCGLDFRLIRISPTGSVSIVASRVLNRSFYSVSKAGDQLYLGTLSTGLEILDLDGCDVVSSDGFESGDFAGWSNVVP